MKYLKVLKKHQSNINTLKNTHKFVRVLYKEDDGFKDKMEKCFEEMWHMKSNNRKRNEHRFH